ncbi:MAG: hypothetical protein KDB23_30635, partial [Planctomycetales bacterium]|nr:hypothetical protein [Planctomycetales bacterium]
YVRFSGRQPQLPAPQATQDNGLQLRFASLFLANASTSAHIWECVRAVAAFNRSPSGSSYGREAAPQ